MARDGKKEHYRDVFAGNESLSRKKNKRNIFCLGQCIHLLLLIHDIIH